MNKQQGLKRIKEIALINNMTEGQLIDYLIGQTSKYNKTFKLNVND